MSRGGFWITRRRIPQCRSAKHLKQHPQHGVEGRTPHRAEAFIAMRRSEGRRRRVTTLQTTRHGNRAVARYNQIPGGRDQQIAYWTRTQRYSRGGRWERGKTLPEEQTRQQDNKTNTASTETRRTTEAGQHKHIGHKNKQPTQPHPNTKTRKTEEQQTKKQKCNEQGRSSRVALALNGGS